MPTLLKLMDKDSIPKELGGGSDQVMPTGGKIPDTYYEPAALGFKKISIGRRDHNTITVNVKQGDKVDWEWYSCNGKDIGFDVKCGDTEVVKWERLTEHAGSFTATADGSIDFHWDNRFSMMRGKECTYRTRVNFKKKKQKAERRPAHRAQTTRLGQPGLDRETQAVPMRGSSPLRPNDRLRMFVESSARSMHSVSFCKICILFAST